MGEERRTVGKWKREETQMEEQPAEVLKGTKQAGTTREKWKWVEPRVWTERMLTALETGVRGGVWFSLIDKVQSKKNLEAAAKKVIGNKGSAGVDRVGVREYAERIEKNIEEIQQEIKEGRYRGERIRKVKIPKAGGGSRELGIPTVKDRVVQTAVKQVIEPIFEKEFLEGSYGFRPERGCKKALKEVERLMQEGYLWVVDADIRSYFDSIPHERMMEKVKEKIADGRVLKLIEGFLKQGIMEGMKEWMPEEGTPQGGVISPLLANIYLHPLDRGIAEAGYKMIRYADDFVIMCRDEEEAGKAMERVREWMKEEGLRLNEEKTRIVDMRQTRSWIEYLGYHFEQRETGIKRWPRKRSLRKLKDAIRERTKRCNGHSMEKIIKNVNANLRGWFEYFKQSNRWTFKPIDQWVRMRLRSILRKRAGRRGRGRGWDNVRWPNLYFEARGLFSVVTACEAIVSPRRG